ncbi:MAG: TetR/AcrR family transcriptional regulator [Aquihabitans sp.]
MSRGSPSGVFVGDQQRGEDAVDTSILAAAYEQQARTGPVSDGRSVSLSEVARLLGMSRANLYRRWPTTSDLTTDIAVYRSTPDAGWHALVCEDDGGTLEAALTSAFESPSCNGGVLTRAAVARSTDAVAKKRVAAWEEHHLVALAGRIRREWGESTVAPWTDIAVAVVALIEGIQLMWAQFAEAPDEPLPPQLAGEVTSTAGRIVGFLIDEVEGSDVPLGAHDADGSSSHQAPGTALPGWLIDALADGSLDLPSYGARRVIDMGVLARTTGVTERALYKRWPTPADLNAALYIESVRRVRDAFGRMILDVFQSATKADLADIMSLVARMNEWFMTPDRFPEAGVHLGLVDVLSDQSVLDRVRASVETGLQVADMQTAGIVQGTGFRLRSDVRLRTYTMLIVGMGMGSHRTTALHPALIERRLRYRGTAYLASGVGHTAMTRTCTEPLEPDSERSAEPHGP